MSKFFGGGFSSSSSEDSSSEESEEEVKEVKQQAKAKAKPTKKNESSSDEESSSEEEKKVSKNPEKDELRKSLKQATSKVEENLKTKNIEGLNQDFLSISDILFKNEKLIAKIGDFNFLLKLLMKMDDYISSAKGEEKDQIAKCNLKHKFKQFMKPKYKNKVEAYRKNPKESEDEKEKPEKTKEKTKAKKKKESSEEESDEGEESEEESDEGEKKKSKGKKKKDDDDSDIHWSEEDSSSSSESESGEEKDEEQQKTLSLEERRKKWLKKPEDMPGRKKEKVAKPKDNTQVEKALDRVAKEKDIRETKLGRERFNNIDFTSDYVTEQHLKKIKKTADKDTFEENYEPALLKMYQQVTNKKLRVEVLYKLITGVYSIIKGHVDYYMSREKWNSVV